MLYSSETLDRLMWKSVANLQKLTYLWTKLLSEPHFFTTGGYLVYSSARNFISFKLWMICFFQTDILQFRLVSFVHPIITNGRQKATEFHISNNRIHHIDPVSHKVDINECSIGQNERKYHCVIVWG